MGSSVVEGWGVQFAKWEAAKHTAVMRNSPGEKRDLTASPNAFASMASETLDIG